MATGVSKNNVTERDPEAKTISSAVTAAEAAGWLSEALQARAWPEPRGVRIPGTICGNPCTVYTLGRKVDCFPYPENFAKNGTESEGESEEGREGRAGWAMAILLSISPASLHPRALPQARSLDLEA